MKTTVIKALITSFAMFNVLGGCTWKPWGSDKGENRDAGVVELEKCTLRVSACRNTCYEADLGRACLSCCDQNVKACDRGEDYSFNDCPNKE